MKKSLIAAWMLIAVVFALGLMGLAGRSILPNTQKEKITVPDPGVSDSSVSIRVKIGDTVQKMNLDSYVRQCSGPRCPLPLNWRPSKPRP